MKQYSVMLSNIHVRFSQLSMKGYQSHPDIENCVLKRKPNQEMIIH